MVYDLPDEFGFYGQTFTATSEDLRTIEFAVDNDGGYGTGPVELTVMVATIQTGGSFHPDQVVFQSPLITIPYDADLDKSILSVDTSGLTLIPGQQYVILFNANPGGGLEDGSLRFVTNTQIDAEYFVYNHTVNQDDAQAFAEHWNQDPLNGFGFGDIALRLSYGV